MKSWVTDFSWVHCAAGDSHALSLSAWPHPFCSRLRFPRLISIFSWLKSRASRGTAPVFPWPRGTSSCVCIQLLFCLVQESRHPPPPPRPALPPLKGRPFHVPGFLHSKATPLLYHTSWIAPSYLAHTQSCLRTKDGRAPTLKTLQTSDTTPPRAPRPSLHPSCLAQRSSRSPGLLSTWRTSPSGPPPTLTTPERLLSASRWSLCPRPALTVPKAGSVTPRAGCDQWGALLGFSLPGSLD